MADLTVQTATDEHLPAILALLQTSLGWDADDARFEEFFRWKHHDNPYGRSLALVAVDDGRVVGVRLLLRWELTVEGEPVRAVRAVDTATHPDARGRGVFTHLTRHALEVLEGEGVGFVFNTPNDQSRPGYLKMGWSTVGRLPLAARPLSVRGIARMARARGAGGAQRWGEPASVGLPAHDALADDALEHLVASLGTAGDGVRTALGATHLRWRYGLPALGYRVLAHPAGPAEGVVVFRVRRRGPASEAAVCDVLVPGDDPRARRALLRRFAAAVDADYAIGLGPRVAGRSGFVRLPRQGPILTWRGVTSTAMPELARWRFGLGDIELF